MAIFISMQVFVLVIMPKIKSQPVINTIWLTFMAICMSCTFEGVRALLRASGLMYQLIRVCLPAQDSLSIIQNVKAKKPTYMFKNETKRHKAWAAAPIAMAFVAIMSTYLGTQIAIPLTAFAWTMTCIAYFTPTKIIAKHLIVLLNGYLVSRALLVPCRSAHAQMAVVVLAFVIGGIASLFDSKSDDKANKPKDNDEITLPSIWVFQIMLTFALAIPATAPGQIVRVINIIQRRCADTQLAMAYRFDHSKTSSVTNLAAGPGEAVVVPTSVPSSPKPTFYAGLFALAVSLLGVKVLDITVLGLPNGLESVYLFVTVPVVTFAIVGSAWSRGQLREFWNYTET